MKTAFAAGVLAAVAAWAAGAPEVPRPPGPGVIVLRHCVLEYDRTTRLGAAQMGVLGECLVREGDHVEAGQVLGRLRDADLRAELELRKAEAAGDVVVRLAEARAAYAEEKAKTSAGLARNQGTDLETVQLHRLQATAAG